MKYIELPEEECEGLLTELFQSIPQLLQQVAPNGFANSVLVSVFHPSPQQQYKEYRHSKLQLILLQRRLKKSADAEPTKSYEQFLKEVEPSPVDEQYETVSIFGDCLWNIFSNNHTIYNQQAESYDLGSWRSSGGFIADVINKLQLVPGRTFDYMDFYMGNVWTKDRTNLRAIYEFIFTRLKEKGLDWEFSFPRMGIVNFNTSNDTEPAPENYNPATALQQHLEQQQKQEEANKLQQELDEVYNKEFDKARYEKPSQEVMAYYNIYGHWPEGHPLNENK